MNGKAMLFTILILLLIVPPCLGNDGLIELYPNHYGPNPHDPFGFSCKTDANKNQDINFTSNKIRCKNDDAKSMVLNGFFQKGTTIILYDNSGGKRSDDWFEIVFLSNMSHVRYVIPTFEYSFQDIFIKATFHKKNGLNGKVSRMEIRVPQ